MSMTNKKRKYQFDYDWNNDNKKILNYRRIFWKIFFAKIETRKEG